MVDFFVEWMQALCILGLICGAYLSIAHRRDSVESRYIDPLALQMTGVTDETMTHARV